MQALDNPFHASLSSRHRHIALVDGAVARYPALYAPFLGVESAQADASASIDALLAPNESVYLLGIVPQLSARWRLEAFRPLAQMVCDQPLQVPDGPEVIELDDSHRADVLALTGLVYPHYFRERTMDMGRYFGIYQQGQLAAIIGERLGMDDAQEVSAVCTHPDFNGRGYARRMLALLTNDILAQGRLAFLHVSHENARAKHLYEQMGFSVRRDIGFWSLRRE